MLRRGKKEEEEIRGERRKKAVGGKKTKEEVRGSGLKEETIFASRGNKDVRRCAYFSISRP